MWGAELQYEQTSDVDPSCLFWQLIRTGRCQEHSLAEWTFHRQKDKEGCTVYQETMYTEKCWF